MNRKYSLVPIVVTLVVALLLSVSGVIAQEQWPQSPQAAIGTAFTYQGQLKNASGPVNDHCDFQFSLWDSPANLTGQIGTTQAKPDITVNNGFFTVPLDFGASAFGGEARWLEITVRCPAGSGSFVTLAPRQSITPAPYAMYSTSTGALQGRSITTTAPASGQVLKWNGDVWSPADDAIGAPGSGDISGVYAGYGLSGGGASGDVTLAVVTSTIQHAGQFGNCPIGSSIRAVNQDGAVACEIDDDTLYNADVGLSLDHDQFSIAPTYRLPQMCGHNQVAKWNGSVWVCADDNVGGSGSYWTLTGNTGTNPNANFLGTTDNVTLTLRVSNTVAYRIVPAVDGNGNFAPNLIAGSISNTVAPGVYGAAIAGGGASNTVKTSFSFIGGGYSNTIGLNPDHDYFSDYAFIGGGAYNATSNTYTTVGGGAFNTSSGVASVVGGGGGYDDRYQDPYNNHPSMPNVASGNWSVIGGGAMNTASGDGAVIGGGGKVGGRTDYWGGGPNTASGDLSVIDGGGHNTAQADISTVGGGYYNTASGFGSVVAGGYLNRAATKHDVISGGYNNSTYTNTTPSTGFNFIGGGTSNIIQGAEYSTIAGGSGNTVYAGSDFAVIGGGNSNAIHEDYATVGGGRANDAHGTYGTVGGGQANAAHSNYGTVGGGLMNFANGLTATIAGGEHIRVTGQAAAVAGGSWITVTGDYAAVGGGQYNIVSDQYATVGGGYMNAAAGRIATIAGGEHISVTGQAAAVAGGSWITVTGDYAAAGGGRYNTVSSSYATVGGGALNAASGFEATIGGGQSNTIPGAGLLAFIGGGYSNTASGTAATVSGGSINAASKWGATVGGGNSNTASGNYATIPGGASNSATMSYTLAAGHRAQANHDGAFVWADSTNMDFVSTANDQFLIRANGGVGINTNQPRATIEIAKSNGSGLGGTLRLSNPAGGTNAQVALDFATYDVGSNAPAAQILANDAGNYSADLLFQTKVPGAAGNALQTNMKIKTNGAVEIDHPASNGSTNLCLNALGEIALCSSSQRYKNHIADLALGLDTIAQLRPVTFDWKNSGQADLGFVAEEVQQLTPLLTTLNAQGQIEGVKYDRITAVLVKGMQEQQQQIIAQQHEIRDLQARLTNRNPNAPAASFNWFNALSVLTFGVVIVMLLQQRRSKRGES